jgi:type II secretory pathway pseudopilin PulG
VLKVRNLAICGLAVIGLVLALTAPSAIAQSDATIDPDQASPAGTQYKLPLDAARGDAAPRSPREPASRSGAAPADQSAIHSENGFGSSAQVPGVGDGAPRGSGQRPTPAKTDAPAASGGQADGNAGVAAAGLVRSPTADPSGLRVYGLLALGVALAVGVAVAGRLARRPH